MGDKILMVAIVLFVVVLVAECSSPKRSVQMEERPDFPTTVKEVCLNGHVYYYNATHYRFLLFMAPKLNDDGTPVKCVVEEEE